MKQIRIIMNGIGVAALLCLFVSCGGKGSRSDYNDDENEELEAISNGLLGSKGAEIITQIEKFENTEKNYKQSIEALDRQYEEELSNYEHASESEGRKAMQRLNEEYGPKYESFRKELQKLEERRQEWTKKMMAELYDHPVAIEVAEGAPLKVVDAFVQEIRNNHTLFIVGLVELTADRPHINDRSLYGTDQFKLTIVPVDDNDDIMAEIQVLPTELDHYDQDFLAGRQLEFTYVLPFEMLKAKKLLIHWDRPTDQIQISDNVKVKGELGMFQLQGPVRECQWEEDGSSRTLGFDHQGMWTSQDGTSPFGSNVKVQRDVSGRIIKIGDTSDEEYRTYKYNDEGQLTEMMEKYMDGASVLKYTYNNDGNCVKVISTYSGDDPVTIQYTIINTDDHNNWTKRKDQYGNVATRTITYY